MAERPGLGLFSKLPPELRDQIWLEFLPVKDDGPLIDRADKPIKVDLRVFFASKELYEEISTALFSRTCLHFDLLPTYTKVPTLWSTVYFKDFYQERKSDIGNDPRRPTWRLRCRPLEKDRRFDSFPFHKIRAIEVDLFAPDIDDRCQLFWLRGNVNRTVNLFGKASSLPPLVIRLQKYGIQDWYYTYGLKKSFVGEHNKYNYDLMILPFCNLRNLKSIKIETHSEELKRKMNWECIDWASNVVSGRTNNYTFNIDQAAERELDRKVEDDDLLLQQEMFRRWGIPYERGRTTLSV